MCDKNSAQSSKDLLYFENMDTTVTKHTVEMLENKKKRKPEMHFQKSSAMEKANKLLSLLEQSQNELNEKSSDESNIEVIEGDSFIKMAVTFLKNVEGDNPVCGPGDEESCINMIDSSNADIEQFKDEEGDCLSETEDYTFSKEDDSSAEPSGDESENVLHEREQQHISVIEEKD